MKNIKDMSDESLMRVIRHLRNIKENLIVNYKKILDLTDNEGRKKEIKAEIFFLGASDVENISETGKLFLDEANERNLI